MIKSVFYFSTMMLLLQALPGVSTAQSSITFRVDMRAAMSDSTFIPSEHTIAVMGNQVPFSRLRTIKLNDGAPKDSIYTAKVQFPSIVNGKKLTYRFLILKNGEKVEEQNSRSLPLGREDKTLPVVSFGKFSR